MTIRRRLYKRACKGDQYTCKCQCLEIGVTGHVDHVCKVDANIITFSFGTTDGFPFKVLIFKILMTLY